MFRVIALKTFLSDFGMNRELLKGKHIVTPAVSELKTLLSEHPRQEMLLPTYVALFMFIVIYFEGGKANGLK